MKKSKAKVIWVEDDISSFEPVRELLTNHGVLVVACDSLDEAEVELSNCGRDYDLLIIDNILPDKRSAGFLDASVEDDYGARYLLDIACRDIELPDKILFFSFYMPQAETVEELKRVFCGIRFINKSGMFLNEIVKQILSIIFPGSSKNANVGRGNK